MKLRPFTTRPLKRRRRGTILILAMVIVFVLAAMVLSLGKQVRTQTLAASNDLAAQKADAAEHGAEQFCLSILTDDRDNLTDLDESYFSAVQVGDAYFWITRPDYGDTTNNNWGLMDESSKLNLNVASQAELLAMPGVTDDIAGAIIDWRDTDDTPSTNGAESSTYSAFGYSAKNADFETVDELMLINGMTYNLLYGTPVGQTDQQGQTSDAGSTGATASSSGDDWYLNHGLFDYFTAWGAQPNTASDGTARVNVADATTRDALRSLLEDKIGTARGDAIVGALGPQPRTYENIFDFADASGMQASELALVEDYITTVDSTATPPKGLVNVNTAPREVLVALFESLGLTDADADSVIAERPSAIADNPNTMAWIYDVLKAKAASLGNTVCGRGRQYSADIVAASGNGRGFRHVRVVIDTTSTPPRIVYRRDLSDRGWPLDPTILANLKSGVGLGGAQQAGTGAH